MVERARDRSSGEPCDKVVSAPREESDEHPRPLHDRARHDCPEVDGTLPLIVASGEWPPNGLEYHVAFSTGGDFRVSEICDSKEQFEAFEARLMPILAANGVELAGPPEVLEVYNIIKR